MSISETHDHKGEVISEASEDQMLPFFPIPMSGSGETVYSLICRCAERLRPVLTDAAILNALTGQRYKTTLLSALPGYLHKLSTTLPKGHPWRDAELIVRDHTGLPYFIYFDPPKERALLVSNLSACRASSHPLIMALGLTKYRCGMAAFNPRFCPLCVEKDKKKFGFSIFRREHQLPGVALCMLHGKQLYHGCTVCGKYPIHNRALSMAGRCFCHNGIVPLPAFTDLPSNCEGLLWIAQQSYLMVSSSGTQSENIREDLRKLVLQKGFSHGSLISYHALAEVVDSRFGAETLEWLGAPAWKDGRPSAWIRRLLYGQLSEQKRSPAIYFLLIIGALFKSIKEFEHAVKNLHLHGLKKIHDLEKSSSREPDTPGPEWANDIDLSDLIKTAGCGLPGISQRIGVPLDALISEIRRQGVRVPLSKQTRRILREKKLKRIRSDLRKGVAKTEIYRRYGCSEWSVILIELGEPGLREKYHAAGKLRTRERNRRRLTEYISSNPSASRSDILIEMPGVYDYMVKIDKDWFYSQIPDRKKPIVKKSRKCRVDWVSLDRQKAKELDQVVDKLLRDEQKPVFLTKHVLLKCIGILSKYSSNPERFPKVNKIIEKRVETYKNYVKRRVQWAVREMAKNGEALSVNKLRRIAGMSAQVIRDHRQLVMDTAKELDCRFDDRSFFQMKTRPHG